jgi:hypothetical protein
MYQPDAENNSTGHETLERRLVQLLVIARDIQSVLHSTTSELYRTTYRNSTLLHVVPTRQVSGLGDLVRTMTAIASTIDDGLSVIFFRKRRNCARLAMNRIPFSALLIVMLNPLS